jgi:hypothetical protein
MYIDVVVDDHIETLFAELQRNAEQLLTRGDNEAARHDLLVRPILTSPTALGWEPGEALPQVETTVPREVIDSYYWRDASPRKRRPDLVLVPYRIGTVVGVVEEKKRQASMGELEAHVGQLLEYQYLHRCVWGILTDGEKWVVTRNHEIFHRFNGLHDLRKHLRDLQECVGRSAILERFQKYGVWDLVYVRPAPALIVMGSVSADTRVRTFGEFLSTPSKEGRNLLMHLYASTKMTALERIDGMPDSYVRTAIRGLFGSAFSNHVGTAIIAAEVALKGYPKSFDLYRAAAARCIARYPMFQTYCDELTAGVTPSPGWVARFAHEADYLWCLSKAPVAFLNDALSDHRVLANTSLSVALEQFLAAATSTA